MLSHASAIRAGSECARGKEARNESADVLMRSGRWNR